ncbi:MAG: hypothetical protein ACR2NB_11750 [Solirubrobacteraceae bacterium]
MTGLATAAVAVVGMTDVAQAAQPGDVCQVNTRSGGWSILASPIYYVYYPSSVRIVDYNGPDNYIAHGNGQADGSMLRIAVNQGTCHP